MVKFLLDKVKLHYKGNIPDRIKQAASAAAGGGHLEVLKLLVGDENFDKMDNRSELSSGLLVPAASTGRADMIRSILQMSPEPDFKDRLSAACQANQIKNFEIPQLLPATNKMPTIEVYPISTMLVQPAREELIDYVRLLLANGARADYSSARVDFDGPQLIKHPYKRRQAVGISIFAFCSWIMSQLWMTGPTAKEAELLHKLEPRVDMSSLLGFS